jgi:hypothetical protein
MPLVRYKPASRSISARPRRPTTTPDSSLINRVHHKSSPANRCVPRTLTEYVHVAIDDHTRIAFSVIYPDEKQASVLAFLHATLAYYARLGIRFKAVLTDNGPGLPITCLRSGLPCAGPQAPLHSAVHSAHQWQSRALHPDRPARVGLRSHLPELKPTQPGASPLAASI